MRTRVDTFRPALPGACEALERRWLLAGYFVATDGLDTNAGTALNVPFRTIQRAADLAQPGDVVYVRGGTYRETITPARSGSVASPITYRAYNDEPVVINGTDLISGAWTNVGGEVYRASMPWNYRFEYQSTTYDSNQVFFNGVEVESARWPNQLSADVSRPTNAYADNITFSKSDPNLASNDLATIVDAEFIDDPARWVGARIWVNLSRNGRDGQGRTGTVVAASAGSITVTGIDTRGGDGPWGIGAGTEYYLYQPTLAALNATGGIGAALDRGEWYYDSASQQLYLRTPTGAAPNPGQVQAKRRTWGFVLDARSHISVQNIDLFATSLTTDLLADTRSFLGNNTVAPASNLVLDGIDALYVTQITQVDRNYQTEWMQNSGIILSGTEISFQNGSVRYSDGAALSVIGRRNRVLNNVLRDTNISVSNNGAINFGRGDRTRPTLSDDHEVGYNTIRDSAMMGISFLNLRGSSASTEAAPTARIHHNVIHDVMLRSGDSGAIDSVAVDHNWVRIDHNVIYNVTGPGRKGLYLDFNQRVILDHNVVYNVQTPLTINWNSDEYRVGLIQDVRIYNNVLVADSATQAGISNGFGGSNPGTVSRNNIVNNLPVANLGPGSTSSNNLNAAAALFVDAAGRNYQLAPTATSAINQGVSVAPFDDPLVGTADIGAYEYGLPAWAAGAGQTTVPPAWVISGVAFRDANRNTLRDAGENALAGRTVYIDSNWNGQFDAVGTRTFASTDVPKAIPDRRGSANGVATSVLTVPAEGGTIADLRVTISIAHTWVGDLYGTLTAPDGTSVVLMSRNGGSGDNFTSTTFDASATTSVTSGAAPFTGSFRPVGDLASLDGKLAAGTWTLRVEDRANGDVGTINSFSITYGSQAELSTTTDAQGAYAFYNLPGGTYTVRQVVPPGWTTTSPSSGHVVALSAGTSVTGLDFGSDMTDATPPRVTGVWVASTAWTPEFLAAAGDGRGYAVPAGSTQFQTLPWTNLNRISVSFSEPVTVVPSNLVVSGTMGASIVPTSFVYDPSSRTATWTFSSPLTADKLRLTLTDAITDLAANALDGEWTDGTSTFATGSGNGVAGGAFRFRINVLPGDVDRSGMVLSSDVLGTRNRQGSTLGDGLYSLFFDVDGNGIILSSDVLAVRNRQGTVLPTEEPA